MPNVGLFQRQDDAYRETVLPANVRARVVIEAGVSDGWHRIAGDRGQVIGIDSFGASAPGKVLFEHFGFTVEKVSAALEQTLADNE